MVNTFHRKIGFKFFFVFTGNYKVRDKRGDFTPYGTHTNSSRTLKIYWYTPTIVVALTLHRLIILVLYGVIKNVAYIHTYTHTYRQTHGQDKC